MIILQTPRKFEFAPLQIYDNLANYKDMIFQRTSISIIIIYFVTTFIIYHVFKNYKKE